MLLMDQVAWCGLFVVAKKKKHPQNHQCFSHNMKHFLRKYQMER